MKKRHKHLPPVQKALLWKYGLIIFAVVSLTVFYLWEQTQVIRHDVRIRELKTTVESLENQNNRLAILIISLSKSFEIVKRAEDELNMIYPTEKPICIIERADGKKLR